MKKVNHPTTGEILVGKLKDGRIKMEELSTHVDSLLNKEFSYGVFIGKTSGETKVQNYTSNLKPVKYKKPPAKKRKNVRRKATRKDDVQGQG